MDTKEGRHIELTRRSGLTYMQYYVYNKLCSSRNSNESDCVAQGTPLNTLVNEKEIQGRRDTCIRLPDSLY